MKPELWKKLKEYNNYSISSYGRCYSYYTNSILTPIDPGNGYMRYRLYKNSKAKLFLAHRLVALNFLSNSGDKKCVCHKDDSPYNNHVDNLFWASQKENMRDMVKKGRKYNTAPHTSKPIIHLESGQIFSSIKEAGRELDLHDSNIGQVLKNRSLHTGNQTFEYYKEI